MFSILLDESVWGERKLHYSSVWLDMETAFLLAFPSFAPFFFQGRSKHEINLQACLPTPT